MKTRTLCSLVALSLPAMAVHAAIATRTSSRTYNAQGLLASVKGARLDVNAVTRYNYDATGRLATVTDALGHVTSFDAYDMYGNPGRATDANGVVTTLTYTPQGWLQSITRDSAGTPATTTMAYNAVGDVIQTTDADGVVTSYTYDDARRLTDIADAFGNRIHYTLDAEGNRLNEDLLDASGALTRGVTRTFNSLSQVLTVTDGLKQTILTYANTDGYDANGHPQHSSDATGIQRKLGYDALGRLVSTIDNYNGTDAATQNSHSVMAYGAGDQLEGVSDPDGLNTVYSGDGLGDLTQQTSPDTGTTKLTYDAAGNVLTKTDANGTKTTYTYDALNRRLTASYPDSTQNIAYHYDETNSVTGCASSYPIGHPTRLVQGSVTTTYCYDAQGRVVAKIQTISGSSDTVAYTYTRAGRLSSITYPDGDRVAYTRDGNGRVSAADLIEANGNHRGLASNISYLPFGPIASYNLGHGQTVTRSYDANYRVTDISSPALSLHYTRDAKGRVTGITEGNTRNTFAYDPLGRLTGLADAGNHPLENYTYNKTGDRLSKTGSGLATGNYGYRANTHWLTSIGSSARTYDPAGNTISIGEAGSALRFSYDDRGRMTTAERDGSLLATYVYNATGQRVSKMTGSRNLRFAYDENSQLLTESNGNTRRDYLWLDDLPIAAVDISQGSSSVNYVHADALNTPRAITDESGSVLWTWAIGGNPFGEQLPSSPVGYAYNLRFPGQYFDQETAINYNVNRYYDPVTGRYTQADPIGYDSGQSSWYAYVNNNPLSSVDPLGLRADTDLCAGLSAQGCRQMGQFAPPYVGEVMGGALFGVGSVIQGNARFLAQGAARSGLLGQDAMVRIAKQDRAVAMFMQTIAADPDFRAYVHEGLGAGLEYAIKQYGTDPYTISRLIGRVVFGVRTGLGGSAGIGDLYHYLDCGYSVMQSMQLAVPGDL